ncbi:hypothetical protein EAY39_20830 [Vibrio anguillarum]|nr:hypothetical protein [Vibrio anguillarum]
MQLLVVIEFNKLIECTDDVLTHGVPFKKRYKELGRIIAKGRAHKYGQLLRTILDGVDHWEIHGWMRGDK